jgi:hypothetical protein
VLALVSSQHPGLANTNEVCRAVLGQTLGQFGGILPVNDSVVVDVEEEKPITQVRLTAPKPTKLKLSDIPNVPREEIERLDLLETFWDPDPQEPSYDAGSCRALLLEIVRRAAYDWVLYRESLKLAYRELANDAYQWIFVESHSSASWRYRTAEAREFTGFVSICDALEIDPEVMRRRLRELTVKDVLSVGRPAEHRRLPVEDGMVDGTLSCGGIDLTGIPTMDPMFGG